MGTVKGSYDIGSSFLTSSPNYLPSPGNTELKHSAARKGDKEEEEEEPVSTLSVTQSHKYFAVLKQAKLSSSPGRELWKWFRFQDKSLFYKLVVW